MNGRCQIYMKSSGFVSARNVFTLASEKKFAATNGTASEISPCWCCSMCLQKTLVLPVKRNEFITHVVDMVQAGVDRLPTRVGHPSKLTTSTKSLHGISPHKRRTQTPSIANFMASRSPPCSWPLAWELHPKHRPLVGLCLR